MKTPGQVAFEAYVDNRGGKNHDGSDTPAWQALGDDVCSGWEAAAAAVMATWTRLEDSFGAQASSGLVRNRRRSGVRSDDHPCVVRDCTEARHDGGALCQRHFDENEHNLAALQELEARRRASE